MLLKVGFLEVKFYIEFGEFVGEISVELVDSVRKCVGVGYLVCVVWFICLFEYL